MRKRVRPALTLMVILVVALGVWLVLRGGISSPPSAQYPTGVAPHWGVQTKTSGCVARGDLPDSACTPGAIFANVTKTQVCTPGYATSVRDVPQSVKEKVYAEYRITKHQPGQYEIDHLVSLQLGGSNDIANLWPEAANPTPGFHQKDLVENYLNSQICSGAISLQTAQVEIATNWMSVYNRMPKKGAGGNAGNGERSLYRRAAACSAVHPRRLVCPLGSIPMRGQAAHR